MRVASQLDYGTRNICYFCVCHTSGSVPACIVRNPWFCDYYRVMRRPNYARDRYRYLFKEDRPAYFRQLSYRIRRTMDDGIMELLDKGMNTKGTCVVFTLVFINCCLVFIKIYYLLLFLVLFKYNVSSSATNLEKCGLNDLKILSLLALHVRCLFFRLVNERLVIAGGDSLCCGHPNGHRRILHDGVRRKLRLLRRKVPRENILAGSPTGDYVDFVVNNDK